MKERDRLRVERIRKINNYLMGEANCRCWDCRRLRNLLEIVDRLEEENKRMDKELQEWWSPPYPGGVDGGVDFD